MLAFIPRLYAAPDASERLTGTPMGSPSIDYATEAVSQTVNVPSDAFDENLNTFYASYDAEYAWVGLDLGSPHIIRRGMYIIAVSNQQGATLQRKIIVE